MASFYRLFAAIIFVSIPAMLAAQGERSDKSAVTFEELYDEPYNINKLFIHLQPLYGEIFATNVNAGFGLEANYYLNNKFDFKAHMRSTYGGNFYDMHRAQGSRNSAVDNRQKPFTYFEFGGTYHIKDVEKSSTTKIVLYKKSYSGNKWAARVPLNAEVPCKVRQIYGARLGAIIWQSSIDVNNIMRKQDLTEYDFRTSDNQDTLGSVVASDAGLFSNISSTGLYVGGSITWIRNAAFSFDKYEGGVDDLILTTYFDILISPSLTVDDIVYMGTPYDASAISVKKLGFRAGIEGKFNRTIGWGYGGEIGYRPSLDGRMFYAMLKVSFPVFGTSLNYKVESFEKGK